MYACVCAYIRKRDKEVIRFGKFDQYLESKCASVTVLLCLGEIFVKMEIVRFGKL